MKRTHILLILLLAISIGAILSTVADSSTYANFSTAFGNPGTEYHVVGKVDFNQPMDYQPEKNANLFAFYLNDLDGHQKKVLYNGTKPQDFEMSEQIVITGEAGDSIFYASTILMKCPSKYNNPEGNKPL
jgi:cytochrome c-type biogenesis protein CcmE